VSQALAVTAGFWRGAMHDLTRVRLTLAPRPRRARSIVLVATLAAAAFAGGAAVRELLPQETPAVVAHEPTPPTPELQQLREQLDQATMNLRLAESRGQELERQIDTLNQKLTESQDELSFFRKAREGRKH
jgi:hypothetical protein